MFDMGTELFQLLVWDLMSTVSCLHLKIMWSINSALFVVQSLTGSVNHVVLSNYRRVLLSRV